ncbi:hypothetical protein [Candidatus Phytoplasma australiense]|uniref:Uncharacterized protein n=1 Tax=Strawberry lethal yellows phytoplasma (CPA) str. NZSb11 TaxID=980422 RepID=R4S0Y0_PHYAS|nr:hypothetical protein [Candidatus Phytoplasma australiense]AGL90424.1 Hypothetical Protein SLY_0505 [Strawberry lethal yellows phytoplasma (CPA) str. NZSb11]
MASSWQLKELIFKSIKDVLSNTVSVAWNDNKTKQNKTKQYCDILINNEIQIKIKSGQIDKSKQKLTLSGYRLGRFGNDEKKITEFINGNDSSIITVPYHKNKEKEQIDERHIYQIYYLPKDILKISEQEKNNWKKKKNNKFLTNEKGVKFKIVSSMSCQVWWTIPLKLIEEKSEILKIPSFIPTKQ